MYRIVNDFEKHTTFGSKQELIKLACGNEVKAYEILSVHEIIQFIGYAKYRNKSLGNVYFRGQTDLYGGNMIPSLFRNVKNIPKVQSSFNRSIKSVKLDYRRIETFDRAILEPILQHYGLKTPWIDVVDNIWVALWFALHESKSIIISNREYVHYYDSRQEYAYIVLMASDATTAVQPYGVYEGKDTTVVDLRKGTPSFFVRPHAQHAYMIKKNELNTADYSDLIVGIIKIPTSLGQKWIGESDFLKLNSLFPSPHFDNGYHYLLKHYPESVSAKNYGSIQILSD